MISINLATFIFGIIILIVGMVLYTYVKPKMDEYKQLKYYQERVEKKYLKYQGSTCLYHPPNWDKKKDGDYFNYDLRSWDGGKNWYAVELDDDWGLKILGEAEVLYPNFLKHIQGMNALTNYVKEHGAIDGTDPEGIKALENAGFTVTKKDEE